MSPAPRRVRRAPQPERVFQAGVVEFAGLNGWRLYHPPDNRPSAHTGRVQAVQAGYPDLTLVRGPRLVFAELKREGGRTTAAQDDWLAALRVVADAIAGQRYELLVGGSLEPPAVEVYLWTPADWPEIERVLGPA